VSHVDGTVVSPVDNKIEAKQESLFCVALQKSLRLGQCQTQIVEVYLSDSVTADTMQTGVLSPTDDLIMEKLCDFPDELWIGKRTFSVPLTNWSQEPVVLQKNTAFGKIEKARLVDGQDLLWTNTSDAPGLCRVNSTQETISGQSRREELQSQLDVGSCCSEEERTFLIECLLSLNHIFALSEEELGATDLEEHVIDTGQAKPSQPELPLQGCRTLYTATS